MVGMVISVSNALRCCRRDGFDQTRAKGHERPLKVPSTQQQFGESDFDRRGLSTPQIKDIPAPYWITVKRRDMARKIPGVCVARFRPLRQIWYSGYRFGFSLMLGLLAFILLFIIAYLFFPTYVPEGSGINTSHRVFELSIVCVPVLTYTLIKAIRDRRHDGIYVSREGIIVVRRPGLPELVEAEKDPLFMDTEEARRAGARARRRRAVRKPVKRLMQSPEIVVLPTESLKRGRWYIAFRSSTQVLERVPMRWVGIDSENAALNMIKRIQQAV